MNPSVYLYHTMMLPLLEGLASIDDDIVAMCEQFVLEPLEDEAASSSQRHHLAALSVGTPSASDVASSSQPVPVLDVQGDVKVSGIIRAQQFLPLSDERLKCNKHASEHDALSLLKAMKPYCYQFSSSPEGKQVLGLLAQQVLLVFPDAVETDPDGNLRIDWTGVSCLTLQGVQQLDDKYVALADKLDTYMRHTDGRLFGMPSLVLSLLASKAKPANELSNSDVHSAQPAMSTPTSTDSRGQVQAKIESTSLHTAANSREVQASSQEVAMDIPTAAVSPTPKSETVGVGMSHPVFDDDTAMVKHMLEALEETNAGILEMVLNRIADFGRQSVWESFQRALSHGSQGKRLFIKSLKAKQQEFKQRSALCFCAQGSCDVICCNGARSA